MEECNVTINGKKEDLSAMLVGAVRYALGRRTYIVLVNL